jgi:hypothetical protein
VKSAVQIKFFFSISEIDLWILDFFLIPEAESLDSTRTKTQNFLKSGAENQTNLSSADKYILSFPLIFSTAIARSKF